MRHLSDLLVFAAVCMFIVCIAVLFEQSWSKENRTSPEAVAEYDRRIAYNQSLPSAQMTGKPIGYFDKNLKWHSTTPPVRQQPAGDK